MTDESIESSLPSTIDGVLEDNVLGLEDPRRHFRVLGLDLGFVLKGHRSMLEHYKVNLQILQHRFHTELH